MEYIKEKKINRIGREYCEILEEVLRIREDRRKKYGDNFFNTSSNNLRVMAKEKINRFEGLKKYDDDDLLDVVNFIIFAILVARRENANGDNRKRVSNMRV